jgi:hypothetical protein
MSEQRREPGADQDPAPVEHSDAERVSDEEQAEEIEQDPSRNPDEPELRDLKGG